jgi:hypothetical protein
MARKRAIVRMQTLGVKCNGQAYLMFESESSAKAALALAMSGTTVDNTATSSDGKKEVKRKELKLKVTKMFNGFATKKGSR